MALKRATLPMCIFPLPQLVMNGPDVTHFTSEEEPES